MEFVNLCSKLCHLSRNAFFVSRQHLITSQRCDLAIVDNLERKTILKDSALRRRPDSRLR